MAGTRLGRIAFWRGWQRGPRRLLKWGLVAMLALVVVIGGYWYYQHSIQYPSTDDAYIKADVVRVAPQVTGHVIAVPVSDQQYVKQGELLFQLDPKPFAYRVAQAKANLAQVKKTVAAQQAAVKAAAANVRDRQAKLQNARLHYRRTKDLAARHVAAQSELDDARASLDSARADLALAQAKLHQAKVQLGTTGKENSLIQQARSALDQDKLDLAYTHIHAPCSGQLSGVRLQPGDTVHAGEQQFALVCQKYFWVYANFKETDLTRIRPGQVASIYVDMYPNHTFRGVVENVNPASGSAFSLLPPENATGNWVKVTQRVPVRILFVNDSRNYPLRVQTSTEVTINTGPGSKPLGRPRGHGLSNEQAIALAQRLGLTLPGPKSTRVAEDAIPQAPTEK